MNLIDSRINTSPYRGYVFSVNSAKKYRVRVEHTGRSSIEREPESAYENA